MKCKKCGHEFDGKFCPECGASANGKKKGGCLKTVLIVVLILFLLILLIGIFGSSETESKDKQTATPAVQTNGQSPEPTEETKKSEPEAKKEQTETIAISAGELISAYGENGVSADQKYKGKLLEVTGVVDSIDKDILDEAYVTLGTGEDFELISVQCYFDEKDLDSIMSLKKGDVVTIIGKCDGDLINIALLKCQVK